MAQMNRITTKVRSEDVLAISTGGTAVVRSAYLNGEKTGDSIKHNGVDVRRLTGVAVSYCDQGLDGATVETTTPLEEIEPGTIFKAEGDIEITFRADALPGFNGGSPRGVLNTVVFIERLTPVGKVSDLLASAGSGRGAKAAG